MKHLKHRILRTLAAMASLLLLSSLAACAKSGLTDDEIREIYRTLVEDSYALNDVFYGDGLPYEENEAMMKYLTGVSADTDGFKVSYMPVAATAPYQSEAEIRSAAAAVYSDAMCSHLFTLAFEGMSTDDGTSVTFARYIEQDGVLTVRIDLADDAIAMGRTYDFENMTIIADEGSEIRASFPSMIDGEKSVNVKITIVKTASGWRLDSPTY